MKKKFPRLLIKKSFLISIVMLLSGIALFGQDVQFPRAVISSGGGSSSSGSVNFTRWRIGQINVVTLPATESKTKQATVTETAISEITAGEWIVNVYPNPVNRVLKVHFDMEYRGEFNLEIYDVRGSKIIAEKGFSILPGQEAEIDMTGLTPALYLLKVIPAAQGTQKLFKITKQ